MNLSGAALYDVLESLIIDILKTLEEIPEDDLNHWKPAAAQQGGGEMNTLAAIAVHTASAGRWMFLHQVLGQDFSRDRDAEFRATASLAEIEDHFQRWLGEIREHIDELDATDLTRMPPTIRPNHPTWSRSHWLLHMLEHTGIHLGHLQIHRQLWQAERGPK